MEIFWTKKGMMIATHIFIWFSFGVIALAGEGAFAGGGLIGYLIVMLCQFEEVIWNHICN